MRLESEIVLTERLKSKTPELQAKTDEELLDLLLEAGKAMGRHEQEPEHERSFDSDIAEADVSLIRKILADRKTVSAERNLIYLQYEGSSPFVRAVLTEEPPAGVVVNMKAETWSFDGNIYSIGTMHRSDLQFRRGPIGVYDRTNPEHWNRIISISQIETREPSFGHDDCR